MKFFTAICFVLVMVLTHHLNAQIIIRNTKTGKTTQLNFGAKIQYKLFSDSVLTTDIGTEQGIIVTTADTNIILSNTAEISSTDIKYLEIERTQLKNIKGWFSPLLIGGIGLLTRGVTMGTLEGNESKNEELVPTYIAAGGFVTLVGSIPFWFTNKKYDFTTGKYELILP